MEIQFYAFDLDFVPNRRKRFYIWMMKRILPIIVLCFFAFTKVSDAQTIYKIPCVVHVIHADGPENISDAQIKNGIEILSRNYRKLNPDTADIVPLFKPIAADMQIEFELARKDPQGNCTNGITRTRSDLTLSGGHAVKALVHWPREKYLNIYVVRNAAGLAGHALMPFQADSLPEWDGIVISHDYMGNTGTSNDLKSVVLSHEVGHYLNLFHIWGGNNVPGFYYLPVGQDVNCAIGDSVADTPPTKGWSSCNLNGATCDGLLDNVQNFMDYAYCARMFTEGQKQRVHDALNSPVANRNQLWTTGNLYSTGLTQPETLCKADFKAPRRIYCVGDQIQFTDLSYHNPIAWAWHMGDGNLYVTQNPVHSYSSSGVYTVQLIAFDSSGQMENSKYNYIKILNENALTQPYFEGFEDAADWMQSSVFVECENTSCADITTQASASGTKSAYVRSFQDTTSLSYLFSTPKINMLNVPNSAIAFKYAFAKKDSSDNDKLVVKVSKTCGASWITVKTISAANISTAPFTNIEFLPQATHWKSEIISLPPSIISNENIIVRIEFYSAGGNNFYLDDIFVGNSAELSLDYFRKLDFQIYPNPTKGELQVNCEYIDKGEFLIMDMEGKILMKNSLNHSSQIDANGLTNGIYLLKIIANDGRVGVRKFVINKN
jgi:PKD repeat protein